MVEFFRMILRLLAPRERRNFFLLMGLIVLQGFFDMAGVAVILPFLALVSDPSLIETSRFYGLAYSLAGSPETQRFLLYCAFAVIAVILTGVVVKIGTLFAIARFSHMRRYHLSSRLLAGILRQRYDWFLNQHGSHLTKTVLAEVDRMIGATMIPALKVLSQTISLVFVGALLVLVEPVMALVAIATILCIYLVTYGVVKNRLAAYGKVMVDTNTARYRIAQEAFGGIKEVKVEGLEEALSARFRAPTYRLARSQIWVQVISELPRHVLEATIFVGIVVVVIMRLTGPEASLESLLPVLGLFAVAGLRMFPAIQQIYHSLSQMRSGRAIVEEVVGLFDDVRDAEPQEKVRPTPMGLRKQLRLEGVSYAYPGTDRLVLDKLDMEIPALTSVGIVGGTGAGKTTTVDVLLGLLLPEAGRLVIDGKPIDASNRRAWQRSIGYVPQSIFLADDTVASNIAFGVAPEDVDHDAVEQAAQLAELHNFVMDELPEGYATKVGERGVRLSGGQRQRIGIARALYRDPDVLLLDEATSALDNLTERAVMEAVANIGGKKTVVMIAHRLSTVRGCDVIYMMERGKVTHAGTYEELMESSATFRKMATAS